MPDNQPPDDGIQWKLFDSRPQEEVDSRDRTPLSEDTPIVRYMSLGAFLLLMRLPSFDLWTRILAEPETPPTNRQLGRQIAEQAIPETLRGLHANDFGITQRT
jgi:hypothetical protein